jgi:hypothetical protein
MPKRPKKNSTQKPPDIINSFSKINLQKSIAFLCDNNEQTETAYRKIIPFIIASKKLKCLGINVTKEVKDLYNQNYKPPKKEIKKAYRRWKDKNNIVKMALLPTAIYMFSAILNKRNGPD